MSPLPMAGEAAPNEPDEKASPFWQLALFLAALGILVVRAPHLAAGLALLSLVILAHETGHFVTALWQGMRVESFSLGFGPPLVKVLWRGTRYQIAPILIGGFMKPAGESPETDEQIANAKPDEFMGRPWWSRGLVALAGPLVNLLLPVLVLSTVYATVGRLDPQGPPLVHSVLPGSGAEAAHMQVGDLVVKVNGEQVNGINQLAPLVDKQSRLDPAKPLSVEVLRAGKPVRLAVRTKQNPAGKYLMGVGIEASPPPFTTTLLAPEVMTPAEKAGFKAGDVVLSVDGKPLHDGYAFNALFAGAAQDPVVIEVQRGGRTLTISAKKKQPLPDEFDPALVGLLGLDFKPADAQQAGRRERLAPWTALRDASLDTLAMGMLIVVSIREMLAGHVNARESLGGPVAIMRMASQEAERGWDTLIQFMCGISVMLGLLNLMPVPILDGFTVLFCAVEGARGRPLRIKTQILLQNIGLALIGSLFAFALVNDLLRWAGR